MKTFIYEEELDYKDYISVVIAETIHKAYEMLEEFQKLPMYFDELAQKYISTKSILFEVDSSNPNIQEIYPYE